MSFTIISDRLITEYLVEYAAILDFSTKSNTYSPKFTTLTEESSDLVSSVLESITTLNSLPDRDFESSYNLLIQIFQQQEFIEYTELLSSNLSIFSNLVSLIPESEANSIDYLLNRNGNKVKAATVISVLSNFFNSIPENSNLRIEILKSIIKVIEISNSISLLSETFINNLSKWLIKSNASNDEIKSILTNVSNILFKESSRKNSALSLYKSLLKNDEINTDSKDLANFVILSLKSNSYEDLTDFNLSELSSFDPILSELAQLYNNIDLTKFLSFASSNNSIFTKYDLNESELTHILRVASITKLTLRNRILQFSKIASELSIPESEVEEYIFNCIQFGILEGRISQSQQVLYVHKVKSIGSFDEENWKLIKSKLTAWKLSLKEIKETVDQVSNNKSRPKRSQQQQQQNKQRNQKVVA
ncbi:hypothetical protein B5S32_g104 [[Candida] boidinii]|nr:hypothetical protein B5S32_g104 [[Candida] boidinii]